MNKKRLNKELIIKILILMILLVMIALTSFRSGCKFYLLKNVYLDGKTSANVESKLSRWYFNAKIIYNGRIIND